MEKKFSSIVCVDRTVSPLYPEWMCNLVYPELELTGPTKYDLSSLKKARSFSMDNHGMDIFAYYQRHKDELSNCLGVSDLHAIKEKDFNLFERLFKFRAVIGWKSVFGNRTFNVTFLYSDGTKVLWGKRFLGDNLYHYCGVCDPAYIF